MEHILYHTCFMLTKHWWFHWITNTIILLTRIQHMINPLSEGKGFFHTTQVQCCRLEPSHIQKIKKASLSASMSNLYCFDLFTPWLPFSINADFGTNHFLYTNGLRADGMGSTTLNSYLYRQDVWIVNNPLEFICSTIRN